jgi:hypothetical protein
MSRRTIESRHAVVEQAKGVLMLRYGIGSHESEAVLERWAGEALVPIEEVAQALVAGICQGRVRPGTEGTVRWLEQRLRSGIATERDDRDDRETAVRETVPRRTTTAAPAAPVAVPRPAVMAALGQRQWRYTSALHAARVLRSQ